MTSASIRQSPILQTATALHGIRGEHVADCPPFKDGKIGCKLNEYRSVRIVERTVLDAIKRELVYESFIPKIVEAANRFLAAHDNEKVPKDQDGLIDLLQEKQRVIDTITARLDEKDDTTDLKVVIDRLALMQREVSNLKSRIAAVTERATSKPAPVTCEAVAALFEDLRGILNDDLGAAAPLLAALTRPVIVTQEQAPRGKKAEKVANFTLKSVPVLLAVCRCFCLPEGHRESELMRSPLMLLRQAMIDFATMPWTSVRRKSRPL